MARSPTQNCEDAEAPDGPHSGWADAARARPVARRSDTRRPIAEGRVGSWRRRALPAARRLGHPGNLARVARRSAWLYLAAGICGRWEPMRRADAPGRWSPTGSAPPADALTRRPDVAGARLAAWLGHYDFFAASADDVFRQRLMTRLVMDARALASNLPAEELDARALTALKGLISAAVALPDQASFPHPGAPLPAARNRPAGAAGWLPCRAQPGGATGGAAGSGGNPLPAAGRAGPAPRRPGFRNRADGPGPAGDAAWRRRTGPVQWQQGGIGEPDRAGPGPGRAGGAFARQPDGGRVPAPAGRTHGAAGRLRPAAAAGVWTGCRMPAPCPWKCRSAGSG